MMVTTTCNCDCREEHHNKKRSETYLVVLCFLLVTLCVTFALELKCQMIRRAFNFEDDILSRTRRYLVFPRKTVFELIFSISYPVEIPNRDMSYALFMNSAYGVPESYDTLINGPKKDDDEKKRRSLRDVERRHAYSKFQNVLDQKGMNGTACILRTICEAAEVPLNHENGLVGEVLHLILTPDVHDADEEHVEAYKIGAEIGDCRSTYPECANGLLDIVSVVLGT